MEYPAEDCARLERLLARMDEAARAPAHRADPADALTPGELAWAAAHTETCPHCAATAAAAVALVAPVLREHEVELPGDEFFVARRTAILATIRAEAAPGAEAGHPAPRLVASRPAARTAGRAQRGAHGPSASRARRRFVLPAALAACVVLAVATALLRPADDAGGGRGVAADGGVATAPIAGLDPAEIAGAEDAWVVANNDLFVAALASSGDDSLGALSDEELAEIEDVFLATPGWS